LLFICQPFLVKNIKLVVAFCPFLDYTNSKAKGEVTIMSESDLELYGIVGKMFREIRESKNLSLEIVAEYLKIAPKSLQRYECGERKIKIGTIKELCIFYKIKYDDFIKEAKLRFSKNVYDFDSTKKNASPKIIQYYELLNETGKYEATKRVKELTYIPQYKRNIETRAAHNDYEAEPDEFEKMQEDLANLKRPE